MKTSTIAWTLTTIIVLLGLAWYVYSNTTQGAYVSPDTNVTVSGDMPVNMVMPTTTPAVSSTTSSTTVTASTTLTRQ